jgi:peptidoglycan/LPS O-acetylase OafA/YrhL
MVELEKLSPVSRFWPASGETGKGFSLGRRPALDGLRAIAVVMVLVFHTGQFLIGDNIATGGYLGVDVFFALSGFLITSILLEEMRKTGSIDIRLFYIRRARRLFPALYVFLGVWLIILNADPDLESVRGFTSQAVGILSSMFYVANWTNIAHITQPWAMGHMWSLAIEEQFYLVWPAMLWVIWKAHSRFLLGFSIIAIAVGSATLRAVQMGRSPVYWMTDTRLDGLALGAFAAFLLQLGYRPGSFARVLAYPALGFLIWIGYFARVPFTVPGRFDLGYTAVALATCVVIIGSIDAGMLCSILSLRPLRFIGRLSYSIYLWHYPLFWLAVIHLSALNPFVRMSFGFALTLLVAFLSYSFVEQPILRRARQATGPGPRAQGV